MGEPHRDGGQVAIEEATWRDFSSIVRVFRAAFGSDAWSWLEILDALTYPGTVRLKAVDQSGVVGFAIGDRRSKQVGWVAAIGVHPRARRKGIGGQLLQACERELNTPVVRLTLRQSNEAARKLYVKRGYQPYEVWKSYYDDGEDGLVMERGIGQGEADDRPAS